MAEIQDGRQNCMNNIYFWLLRLIFNAIWVMIQLFIGFGGQGIEWTRNGLRRIIQYGGYSRWHILAAAILDFRHIGFFDVIHFGSIRKPGKGHELQAKFH